MLLQVCCLASTPLTPQPLLAPNMLHGVNQAALFAATRAFTCACTCKCIWFAPFCSPCAFMLLPLLQRACTSAPLVQEVDVSVNTELRAALKEATGERTVPQVSYGGRDFATAWLPGCTLHPCPQYRQAAAAA